MKKVQLILFVLLSITLGSCQISLGKKGNGHVVREDRPVAEGFNTIEASAGIDVYLSQGERNTITVEADDNLLPLIKTEVRNGKLKIWVSKNIARSKSKKVYVTFTALEKIVASSGASITGETLVKSESLWIKCSSGAEIALEVFSRKLSAQGSSGSEISLRGKTSTFDVQASSGAEIEAKDLLTINTTAKATSGAEIGINVKEALNAQASSGGDINVYGNPKTVINQKSSSGSIRSR